MFTPSHRGGSGEPLVCLHGFADTWRTWELILPALQARHDVLALTLAGHAGGPPLDAQVADHKAADDKAADDEVLLAAVEEAMDAAGFDTAHLVGNSLGGYLALRLAARGRARTVVALAPAGGWDPDDGGHREAMRYFVLMKDLVKVAVPRADEIASTPEGRRRATVSSTTNFEHIPPALIAHQIRSAGACDAPVAMIERATRHEWDADSHRIRCPVRIVWGTADKLLPWPRAAVRYQSRLLRDADWVLLDGVGHCAQLDVPEQAAALILSFTAG